MILWGVLVFAGYLLRPICAPRYAGYGWLAVYVAGIVGSFAHQRVQSQAHRQCAPSMSRMLIAFLLFIAFGYLRQHWLGHFTPRQMGTFWPIYFMMVYTHRRAVGRARLRRDRPFHHCADADRLFLRRRRLRSRGWPSSTAAG